MRFTGLVTCFLLVAALPALAQAPRDGARQEGNRPGAAEARPSEAKLPPDVVTHHSVELPGRTLSFTATAGSLPLVDPNGGVQAELGFVAYTLDGADPGRRPVTVAINGGPGASSAYLHLLVAGPWRLPLDASAISPSTSPSVVPNADTWLDFTDLVFIDPVDTGYSRANGSREDVGDRYFNIEGDISTLSSAIARWLRTNNRLASPKFYLGESYGGFRGPALAARLQTDLGVGFSGAILVSPVLDFGWLSEPRYKPMEFVTRLPAMAAARLERDGGFAPAGPVTREALRDVESYAAGEYLSDLVKGPRDAAALDRASGHVATLTGLDRDLVRRLGARIDLGTFQREFRRSEGRVLSAYDAGVSNEDPDPTAPDVDADDAILAAMTAPLTSAVVDLLRVRLGWRVQNQRYELLNGSVAGGWRYGRGRRPAEVVDALRKSLALDPRMRVVIAHGLTDLVTPYFATDLILRQLPAFPSSAGPRLLLATFPGGHMFYLRDASRAALRRTAVDLLTTALGGRDPG